MANIDKAKSSRVVAWTGASVAPIMTLASRKFFISVTICYGAAHQCGLPTAADGRLPAVSPYAVTRDLTVFMQAHTSATTQPIKVQPRNRLVQKIAITWLCLRTLATTVGKK